MTFPADPPEKHSELQTPEGVRERCIAMLRLAEADGLAHFTVSLGELDAAAEYVGSVIRERFPSLQIPPHSRWRHFEAGGIDRRHIYPKHAASRLELCVISVLLDAGAGPCWSYSEPETGLVLTRSEGLAVASLHAFLAGTFSGHGAPQADVAGLEVVSEGIISDAFQAGPGNTMEGLAGRAALMRRLGTALRERSAGRLSDLFSPLHRGAAIPARDVLITVLRALRPIWPRPLGDVWLHPTLGLVPFHKLSQWLGYSLIETLEAEGISVTAQAALTGLAEYRNGGLFLDMGVVRLRDSSLTRMALAMDHPAVVEWRALTVALLDRLVPLVRTKLGAGGASLTMAQLLEGGTWEAGRRMARECRGDLSPPLRIISDGSVF